MSSVARARRDGCLTDLRLDQYFAGELGDEALASVTAHLAGCEDCRARHEVMAAERQRFLELRPSFDAGAKKRPPRVQRLWAATTVFAAAAAAILLLRSRTPGTDGENDVRLKGGAHVGFFVQRGQTSERGAPGQLLHPGDRVRFTYTSPAPTYLAIYSLDSTRTASVFFPPGDRAAKLEPGTDTALDSMVELDQAPSEENIHALFCDHDFSVEEYRAVLERSGTLVAPGGCRVHTFEWSKGPLGR